MLNDSKVQSQDMIQIVQGQSPLLFLTNPHCQPEIQKYSRHKLLHKKGTTTNVLFLTTSKFLANTVPHGKFNFHNLTSPVL